MTEAKTPERAQRSDPAGDLASLNARTAKRQKMLFGTIGAVLVLGAGWFVLGGEDSAIDKDTGAQTIDTAGLVNRDLADREFVTIYGNRLDAVTREQKALREAALPRKEVEDQLAALKAENAAMRSDGGAGRAGLSAVRRRCVEWQFRRSSLAGS